MPWPSSKWIPIGLTDGDEVVDPKEIMDGIPSVMLEPSETESLEVGTWFFSGSSF